MSERSVTTMVVLVCLQVCMHAKLPFIPVSANLPWRDRSQVRRNRFLNFWGRPFRSPPKAAVKNIMEAICCRLYRCMGDV